MSSRKKSSRPCSTAGTTARTAMPWATRRRTSSGTPSSPARTIRLPSSQLTPRPPNSALRRLPGLLLVVGHDLDRLFARPQRGHGALDHRAPLVDDDGPVADLLDLVQQVRGEQHGRAGRAELADELAHVLHALRVEAARGLVEDDHLGPAEQRVGDAETLLHAVRVAAHLAVGAVQQADRVEHLGDALLGGVPAGRADQAQVAARAHVGVEGRHLDEAAQVAQGGDALRRARGGRAPRRSRSSGR